MTKASTVVSNPIRKRWAFLVGINSYTDGQYPDLNFCVNDVKALEYLLTEVGYSVTSLHDEKDHQYVPTRNNVLAELTTFCKAHPDDLLLIYFACHGTRVNSEPYLIAQDTRAALFKDQSIKLADIELMLHQSDASRKILMLDACHTGIEMGRDITDPEFIQNVYEQAEGYALLAASTAQQKAFELQSIKHGVFNYFILKGLRGEADDQTKNFVTVDDLRKYVLHSIRDWSKSEGGLVQEPTDKREGIGDFILVDYRDQAKPSLTLERIQPSRVDQNLGGRSSDQAPSLSRAQQLQLESLEQELENFVEQFKAVTKHLKTVIDPVTENKLKRQRDHLLEEIQKIEEQILKLKNLVAQGNWDNEQRNRNT